MMTSSNRNIFCVAGSLWGESTGHRWIPLAKAIDAKRWCFLWSAPGKNGWANNRGAGDLRRHCAQYDVTVMQAHIEYNLWNKHTVVLCLILVTIMFSVFYIYMNDLSIFFKVSFTGNWECDKQSWGNMGKKPIAQSQHNTTLAWYECIFLGACCTAQAKFEVVKWRHTGS